MLKKFLFSSLLFSFLLFSLSPLAHAKDKAAVVTKVVGALFAKSLGEKNFHAMKRGDFVYEGMTLKTGKGDKASLAFVSGMEVKINELTTYTIRITPASRRGQGNDTHLSGGRLWFKVLRKNSKFQVRTPVAVAAIRGTEGDVKFEKIMTAACYEGTFDVYNANLPDADAPDKDDPATGTGVPVKEGQQCVVQAGRPPDVKPLGKKDAWQEGLTQNIKGAIRLAAERAEALQGTPMKINVGVATASGDKDTAFEGTLTPLSDALDLEYSPDGRGSWTRGALDVSVMGGQGSFWVRCPSTQMVNVSVLKDGYEVVPARFRFSQSAEKTLNVEVENQKGERQRLRIKFKR